MATATGARQGCKLGGLVFAAVYEQARADVRFQLREANVAFTFRVNTETACWLPSRESDACTDDAAVEVALRALSSLRSLLPKPCDKSEARTD